MDKASANLLPSRAAKMVIQPGSRFGKLTCIECVPDGKTHSAAWRCRCKCGGEVLVRESLLRSGVKTNCGCSKSRAKDLTGRQFGRLTALEPLPNRSADGSIRWLCRCSCGEYTAISSNKLRMGHTQSCGCYQDEIRGDGRTFIDGTCLEIIASEKLPKNNTSGRKGVSRYRNSWAAYITYAEKQYYLGRYATIERASAVRAGAEKLRLEFAQRKIEGLDAELEFSTVLQQYLQSERFAWEHRAPDLPPRTGPTAKARKQN